MSTTQLFVELLVIGFGTLIGLGLVLAAVFGLDFRAGLPRLDTAYAVALGAVAYVVGILMDRLARVAFGGVEDRCRIKVLGSRGLPPADHARLERQILVRHRALAAQIQYNRSRLRIARAWAINFVLIALGFATWNGRVERFGPGEGALLVLAALGLSGVSTWAANRLCRDHYTNLAEGHAFLATAGTPAEEAHDEPGSPDAA